jgi:hypothetical protein
MSTINPSAYLKYGQVYSMDETRNLYLNYIKTLKPEPTEYDIRHKKIKDFLSRPVKHHCKIESCRREELYYSMSMEALKEYSKCVHLCIGLKSGPCTYGREALLATDFIPSKEHEKSIPHIANVMLEYFIKCFNLLLYQTNYDFKTFGADMLRLSEYFMLYGDVLFTLEFHPLNEYGKQLIDLQHDISFYSTNIEIGKLFDLYEQEKNDCIEKKILEKMRIAWKDDEIYSDPVYNYLMKLQEFAVFDAELRLIVKFINDFLSYKSIRLYFG